MLLEIARKYGLEMYPLISIYAFFIFCINPLLFGGRTVIARNRAIVVLKERNSKNSRTYNTNWSVESSVDQQSKMPFRIRCKLWNRTAFTIFSKAIALCAKANITGLAKWKGAPQQSAAVL